MPITEGDRVLIMEADPDFGGELGRVKWVSDTVGVALDSGGNGTFPIQVIAQILPVLTPEGWMSATVEERKAYVLRKGIRICASTDLAEEFTYGFGELSEHGYWQYPCQWYENLSPEERRAINGLEGGNTP